MDNDILGRLYVAADAPSTVWVVSDKFQTDMKILHALLLKSGEPSTTKLVAVQALMDKRLYRKVE